MRCHLWCILQDLNMAANMAGVQHNEASAAGRRDLTDVTCAGIVNSTCNHHHHHNNRASSCIKPAAAGITKPKVGRSQGSNVLQHSQQAAAEAVKAARTAASNVMGQAAKVASLAGMIIRSGPSSPEAEAAKRATQAVAAAKRKASSRVEEAVQAEQLLQQQPGMSNTKARKAARAATSAAQSARDINKSVSNMTRDLEKSWKAVQAG